MSPRVPPPNYTQAPNVLLDELLPEIGTLAELKVTLVVVRHTIGWHEEESQLSLTDLERRTGLSRRSAIDGIKAGIERGTIERRIEGEPGAQESFYALNLSGEVSAPGLVKNLHQAQESDCTSAGEPSAPGPIEKETSKENTPLTPPQGGSEEEDWEKVLEQLADVVPGMTLKAFRQSLSIVARDGHTIVLHASDDIVAGWTRSTFLGQIEMAAARVFGADTVVELPKSETEERREQAAAVRRRRPPQRQRKGFLS